MITPFINHFFFLKSPVLLLLRRDPRKLTLRTLREVKTAGDDPGLLDPTEVERLLNEHAGTRPGVLFGSRPVQGSQLADRLAGRLFDEIGGGEYHRSYNNCNCGGFNCYSNCNCNCACACDCNCYCVTS